MTVARGLSKLGVMLGTTDADWIRALGRPPSTVEIDDTGGVELTWRSRRLLAQTVRARFSPDGRFLDVLERGRA